MLGPFKRIWQEYLHLYHSVTYVRMLVLGVLVGIFAGLIAVLFRCGLDFSQEFIQSDLAGLGAAHGGEAGEYRPWVIPVALVAVAFITGWLVNKFLPESIHGVTDGTDAMIKAFHQNKGQIKPKAPIIKGITSIMTIAAGGSAGQEGPVSQLGAGLGCWFANKFGLSTKERRILMLTGAAGGLGAIFLAPLGGAMTAIEVIYKEDFESEAIVSAVTSSVVAYSIFFMAFGSKPMFDIPEFHFNDARELIFYAVLSCACALAGWIYVNCFRFLKYSVFERLRQRVGIMWAMVAGALIMGIYGMFYPQVLSSGHHGLEQAITGHLPVLTMLVLIFGKTLATSLTLGSGLSGGMFAPALFVGGMTGGVVGFTANSFYPNIVSQPGGYVLVGMATFFAGVANAPIGPLIMVCELSKGYGLLAPLMLSGAICVVITRKTSLYENQVENKFESPAHIVDSTVNILENLQVRDFYQRGRVTILEESITLKGLTNIITGTNEFFFPVKNVAGEISGILSINDVRNLLYEESLFDLVVVGDLARKGVTLQEDEDLYTALVKFVDSDLGQIPVVQEDNPNEILGLINRADVFRAYTEHLRTIHENEK